MARASRRPLCEGILVLLCHSHERNLHFAERQCRHNGRYSRLSFPSFVNVFVRRSHR